MLGFEGRSDRGLEISLLAVIDTVTENAYAVLRPTDLSEKLESVTDSHGLLPTPSGLNDHLLERFIAKLDLDPTLIKSHPNFQSLREYGLMAT